MTTQANTPGSGTGVDSAKNAIEALLTDDLQIGNTNTPRKEEKSNVETREGHPETDPNESEEETEHLDESEHDEDSDTDDGQPDESEGGDESNTEESDNHDLVSDDTTFSIRDGDKEVPVTLAELKKGYTRQSDYTRKLQALAEDRKTLGNEAQAAQSEREQYRQGLAQIAELYQQMTPQEPTQAQWDELQATDPQTWLVQRAQWQDHKDRMFQIANEYQALTQRQQADMQRRLAARMAEESERLSAAFPEWKDKGKAQAGKQAIREYANTLGYSDDEINSTTDHRIFVLAHKAMMYDRLAGKGKPVPNKPASTKIVRPGTAATAPNSKRSEVTDARKQLRKTGKVDDAARLFEKLL
ncbi:hypothetical protein [Burkholderia vietnamiensis]|uniref:hypothetical protein n=1 Tax=Burkholderia vietnamiensis TaxID=60552 RepID=UPI000AED4F95|nr:hypothetical protein [Burkholderia vietnamiensis]